jgi:hypothetical protein
MPGAFDLVARGEDVGEEELAVLREGEVARGVSLDGLRERWARIRDRLAGLRSEEVLCTDAEATISVFLLAPPPGGRASISYRQERAAGHDAGLKLFGVGFGAGGTVTLGSALDFTADEQPLELLLHVRATATRYVDSRRDQSLVRADISALDGAVDYEIRVIDDSGGMPGFDPGDPLRWQLEKRVLLAESRGSEPVTFTYPEVARRASWNAGLAIPAIASAAGLELDVRMSCESTEAYGVEFELQHGHDYAFYAPAGESVIVPYCVEAPAR